MGASIEKMVPWQRVSVQILLALLIASTMKLSSALFAGVDVPQSYLKRDLVRSAKRLQTLGWLARSYQAVPWLFGPIFPNFEVCEPSGNGNVFEITVRETSLMPRGIPFRLLLRLKNGEIDNIKVKGIGCDLSSLAGTVSSSAEVSSGLIDTIYDNKRRVVQSFAEVIFRELPPAIHALERNADLVPVGPELRFKPRRDLFAREGTADKWLEFISGYYFAEARLRECAFANVDGVTFWFYYDPTEPLHSEGAGRNVNPEVIYCAFRSV